MKLLDEYFEKKQEILDYFGVISYNGVFEDNTDKYWILLEYPDSFGKIIQCDQPITKEIIIDGKYISRETRYGKNNIFSRVNQTLILINNSWADETALSIYDNTKKMIDQELVELCKQYC